MSEFSKPMNMKAVLFDFNGTLFFDTSFHLEAWAKIYNEYHEGAGEAPDRGFYCGPCNDVIIRRLAPQLSEEERAQCSAHKEALYREICLKNPQKLHLTAGAEELFEILEEKEIPFALATASIRANVDFYYQTFGLDWWFERSLCVYDDGSYTDKGEMQLEAARRLDVKFSECIVVEDSATAIGLAKKNGAGLIVGIGEAEVHPELIAAGADCCICDFTEFDLSWICDK